MFRRGPPHHRVLRAAFPRYLFVVQDDPTLWRPIRETPGVAAVIHNGAKLQYARPADICALQAAELLAALHHQEPPQWAPGMPVALANGIWRGYPAVVLAIRKNTAHLSVMILGALRRVSAPVTSLVGRDC